MNENTIDRYLLNELSSEEKAIFEEQLKTDKALQEELQIQQEAISNIEELGRIQLKSKLKDIHNEIHNSKPNRKNNVRQLFYRIAAASIFTGAILFTWLWTQKPMTADQLYAQNYEPYALSLTERSSASTTFLEIQKLYENKEYEAALPIFNDLVISNNEQSSQLLLGFGITLLELDKPKDAISQFQKIVANKDFNYEDEALWYLSLSYLKLEDLSNAKTYLNKLATDADRDHHDEANAILKKLK